jgi:zinc/manganese transport system permease protein
MAVGLMIVPAVSSRFWARSLPCVMLTAIVIAIISAFGGLVLSFDLNAPSGPAIILVAGVLYIVSLIFGRYGSLRARYFPFRHLER